MRTLDQKTRISYLMLKNNARLEESPLWKVVRFDVEKNGKIYPGCCCFSGNSSKEYNRFYYHNSEDMEKAISNFKTNCESNEARKIANRKERSEYVPTSKPGDIFVSTWGWEQTNVDFYQLVEVNKKTGVFIEIGSKMVEHGPGWSSMSAHVVADPEVKVGDIFRKQILPGEIINLESYKYCHKWDGSPEYMSWYA